MLKRTIAQVSGRPVILTDTVTKLAAGDAGAIVVTASHGGTSSAAFALEHRFALVVFNDAGVGKDRAGIAALDLLEEAGVAAATVSHDSARIGDAADMWENGVLSHRNRRTARHSALSSGLAGERSLALPNVPNMPDMPD
ncbi:MAG: hypothetical protein R3D02_02590 [Hyphomicrobiales bacterium]